MHKNTKRQNVLWASAAVTGAVFAAFVLPTAGAANAAPVASLAQARSAAQAHSAAGPVTSGSGAVGSGNQLSLPINVPVHVCGIAIAILGQADATCAGNSRTASGGLLSPLLTSGSGGVAAGNQVSLPINLPVSVCGISISVLGKAHASCKGDATTSDATAKAPQEAPPALPQDAPPKAPADAPPANSQDAPPKKDCAPGQAGLSCDHPGSPGKNGKRHGGPKPCRHPKPHNKPGHCQCAPGGPAGGGGPGKPQSSLTSSMVPANRLPTTGADLLGIGAAGLASALLGAGMLFIQRRRRSADAG